ncbi:MAG: hypothetical protein V2A77_11690 [Pseudomonadota bacterium]
MAKLIASPLRPEICSTCVARQYWGRRDLCPACTFELPCPQATPTTQASQTIEVQRHREELICYVCAKREFEGAYVCPDGEKCLRYPDEPETPDFHICGGACVQRYSPNAPIEIRIDELTRADAVEFVFDSRYNGHPALREVNEGLDDTQIHFLKEMIAQTMDAFLEFFNEDTKFIQWRVAKTDELRRKMRERRKLHAATPA